ncbi:MAG: GNAT family N-acetyltransferase [Hyphomicrobiaceae bacterium]
MTLPLTIVIRPAVPDDAAQIGRLHAHVFGPGRFARTAYRVREGTPAVSRFCRVCEQVGRPMAAVRFTEATVGRRGGVLLLGPLAVAAEIAGRGFGRELVRTGLEAAKHAGVRLVVLVGDEPYYGRFGFKAVPAGQIRFPGPVDPARLLAAELQPGALATYSGLLGADGGT